MAVIAGAAKPFSGLRRMFVLVFFVMTREPLSGDRVHRCFKSEKGKGDCFNNTKGARVYARARERHPREGVSFGRLT